MKLVLNCNKLVLEIGGHKSKKHILYMIEETHELLIPLLLIFKKIRITGR